jgi:hypothetical protein
LELFSLSLSGKGKGKFQFEREKLKEKREVVETGVLHYMHRIEEDK